MASSVRRLEKIKVTQQWPVTFADISPDNSKWERLEIINGNFTKNEVYVKKRNKKTGKSKVLSLTYRPLTAREICTGSTGFVQNSVIFTFMSAIAKLTDKIKVCAHAINKSRSVSYLRAIIFVVDKPSGVTETEEVLETQMDRRRISTNENVSSQGKVLVTRF